MATIEQLEATIRALEQRVQILEDVEGIKKLKARYGQLADSRYGEAGIRAQSELEVVAREIARLFTEDAVWDGGKALGVCRGRAEIYERFLKPTLDFSWHYFVKPQISVEGKRARGCWDILAACTTRTGEPQWMAGFEEDEYTKIDGTWLHSSMKLTVVFLVPYARGWAKQGAIPR